MGWEEWGGREEAWPQGQAYRAHGEVPSTAPRMQELASLPQGGPGSCPTLLEAGGGGVLHETDSNASVIST